MAMESPRIPATDGSGAPSEDGVSRRGFLRCMTWAGTGLVWAVGGGVLSSCTLTRPGAGGMPAPPLAAAAVPPPQAPPTAFSFVQISDSHIGFGAEPNRDPTATLQEAVNRINALQPAPAFVLHTGDLTHAQKAGAFDTVAELLKGLRSTEVFYVPGEHDVFADGGQEFLNRFGQGTSGNGWRSFDYQGVHFVGLINVLSFQADTMGTLGEDQLAWLARDLQPLASSTPVVVYAHIPLWSVYPEWGWITDDGEQALSLLRRFGSVTVLNGHIHQIMQKVEGNVTFHTAMSTAFPQPAPGTAPSPGPLQVPSDEVRRYLGLRDVRYVPGQNPLAVVDSTLS
jgi:3',5'-cyclic-AMP phosphodiesterase